jgi:hypothetical protein
MTCAEGNSGPRHQRKRFCACRALGHFETVHSAKEGTPIISQTVAGCCFNSCNMRKALWEGWRCPCSQLCTVLVETFSTPAKTACDMPIFSRRRVTSAVVIRGGRSGTRTVRKVNSPFACRIPSFSPAFSRSAKGRRVDLPVAIAVCSYPCCLLPRDSITRFRYSRASSRSSFFSAGVKSSFSSLPYTSNMRNWPTSAI